MTTKSFVLSTALALTLFAGCSKKEGDCDAVFEHTVSLMPAEMQAKMKDGKQQALAKCEKLSPAARKCALDAASLEDLMKCPK